MRDKTGAHVGAVDDLGYQADSCDVAVSVMSWGSFQVRYVDDLDKVCVKVRRFAELGGMSMQLTLNQAELLRELLDAGIADMRAAKQVLELPAGGAA